MINITDAEFKDLYIYIKNTYGINLEKKKGLLESRLSNHLESQGVKNFTEYYKIIQKDSSGLEVNTLLNKVTTNHSYFMREKEHFNFMTEYALPYLAKKHANTKDIRIWSAGCSSGQEAYTIAMVIDEFFGSSKGAWDTTILATDISTKVMQQGKIAIYPKESIEEIPSNWKSKYFIDKKDGTFEVCKKIKDQVVFRPFNLMEQYSFKKPFDLIFCRNVMIYFDNETKKSLIKKFYTATNVGGFFMIGHSESISGINDNYQYIKPAVYQRGAR